ncbi:hypothetical protein CRENBAI_014129 [Crenichthys baileyi]|uniref:Uncharacterized protein n=1 Tax=Crenichthys baileyi TaxID=28760 RepID=A0AAV9RCG3_9TELE
MWDLVGIFPASCEGDLTPGEPRCGAAGTILWHQTGSFLPPDRPGFPLRVSALPPRPTAVPGALAGAHVRPKISPFPLWGSSRCRNQTRPGARSPPLFGFPPGGSGQLSHPVAAGPLPLACHGPKQPRLSLIKQSPGWLPTRPRSFCQALSLQKQLLPGAPPSAAFCPISCWVFRVLPGASPNPGVGVATGKVWRDASYSFMEGLSAMASLRLSSPELVDGYSAPSAGPFVREPQPAATARSSEPQPAAAAGSSEPQPAPTAESSVPQPAAAGSSVPCLVPEEPEGGLPPLPRLVSEEPEVGLPPLSRLVPEEPVGGRPLLPRHVLEGPVGGLPPRPGPEHLMVSSGGCSRNSCLTPEHSLTHNMTHHSLTHNMTHHSLTHNMTHHGLTPGQTHYSLTPGQTRHSLTLLRLTTLCLGPNGTPGPSLRRGSGHAADLQTPRFVGSSGHAACLLTTCTSVAGPLTAFTSIAGLLTACTFAGVPDWVQKELVTSPCG